MLQKAEGKYSGRSSKLLSDNSAPRHWKILKCLYRRVSSIGISSERLLTLGIETNLIKTSLNIRYQWHEWCHSLPTLRCLNMFFSLEKNHFDSTRRQTIGDAGNKELPVCLFFHYCLTSGLSNRMNEVGRGGIKPKCFYKVSSQIKIIFEVQETQLTCPSFDSLSRGLSSCLLIMILLWELFSLQEITKQKLQYTEVWADKPGTGEGMAILVPSTGHGVTTMFLKAFHLPELCPSSLQLGRTSAPMGAERNAKHLRGARALRSSSCHGWGGEHGGTQPWGNFAWCGLVRSVIACGCRETNQSPLESPKISGSLQVPGKEGHAVPISYNTLSMACRWRGNNWNAPRNFG